LKTLFVATMRACRPGMTRSDEKTFASTATIFPGCERIFDGPVWVYEDKRLAYGELRLCAVGWLQGQVMHMTYTEREDDFHVISLREAEKYEVSRFFQEVPH
jgi:uncharacterized DUF497 family protein